MVQATPATRMGPITFAIRHVDEGKRPPLLATSALERAGPRFDAWDFPRLLVDQLAVIV